MRLLIVDDEPAIRGAIRRLANPESLGFTTVDEAGNGEEALVKLGANLYDVMITDMRMPGMDGIGLLNSIKSESLPRTIIVSAYPDFDYVRLAMHKHAVDYLLKPIKQADLLSALRSATRQSEKASSRNRRDLYPRLWWPLTGYPKKELGITLDTVSFGCETGQLVLVRLLGYRYVLRRRYGNCEELMLYHVEQAVTNYLNGLDVSFNIVALVESGEMLVCVCPDCSSSLKRLQGNLKFNLEFEAYLNSKTGILCCIEAKTTTLDKAGISEGYAALRMRTGLRYWNPEAGVLGPTAEASDVKLFIGGEWEKEIPASLGSYDLMRLSISIHKWASAAMSGEIPLHIIESTATSFLDLTVSTMSEIGTTFSEVISGIEGPVSPVSWIADYNGFCEWMEAVGQACIRHLLNTKRKQCSSAMKEILQYVEENYGRNISLSDLTRHFHMSREHISRMFKKELGENFVIYVLRLRMHKAVELIGESKHTLQTVAEMTGFNDASYFSRTFKEHYGISPEDHRRRKCTVAAKYQNVNKLSIK